MIALVSKQVVARANNTLLAHYHFTRQWELSFQLLLSLRQRFHLHFITGGHSKSTTKMSVGNKSNPEQDDYYDWQPKEWSISTEAEFEQSSLALNDSDSQECDLILSEEYLMSIVSKLDLGMARTSSKPFP